MSMYLWKNLGQGGCYRPSFHNILCIYERTRDRVGLSSQFPQRTIYLWKNLGQGGCYRPSVLCISERTPDRVGAIVVKIFNGLCNYGIFYCFSPSFVLNCRFMDFWEHAVSAMQHNCTTVDKPIKRDAVLTVLLLFWQVINMVEEFKLAKLLGSHKRRTSRTSQPGVFVYKTYSQTKTLVGKVSNAN
jgi:hypothetical protein